MRPAPEGGGVSPKGVCLIEKEILMKLSKKIWIALGAVAGCAIVAAVGYAMLFGFSFIGGESAYFYAQIDNSAVKEVDPDAKIGIINLNGGLPYSYTLPAYNEEGEERALTFGMSRQLKEGAFIRLDVAPVRGVIGWCEMQYSELPAVVQSHYEEPKEADGQ